MSGLTFAVLFVFANIALVGALYAARVWRNKGSKLPEPYRTLADTRVNAWALGFLAVTCYIGALFVFVFKIVPQTP